MPEESWDQAPERMAIEFLEVGTDDEASRIYEKAVGMMEAWSKARTPAHEILFLLASLAVLFVQAMGPDGEFDAEEQKRLCREAIESLPLPWLMPTPASITRGAAALLALASGTMIGLAREARAAQWESELEILFPQGE